MSKWSSASRARAPRTGAAQAVASTEPAWARFIADRPAQTSPGLQLLDPMAGQVSSAKPSGAPAMPIATPLLPQGRQAAPAKPCTSCDRPPADADHVVPDATVVIEILVGEGMAPREARAATRDPLLVEWIRLSVETAALRREGKFAESCESLAGWFDRPESPLSCLAANWYADDCVRLGDFVAAIRAHDWIMQHFGEVRFFSQSWRDIALVAQAGIWCQLGERSRFLACLEPLLATATGSRKGSLLYAAGATEERFGRPQQAAVFYEQACAYCPETPLDQTSTRELWQALAPMRLASLQSGSPVYRELADIPAELSRADILAQLNPVASMVWVGPSCPAVVAAARFRGWVETGAPAVAKLELIAANGGAARVKAGDWSGSVLNGPAELVFMNAGGGWQLSGVLVPGNAELMRAISEPIKWPYDTDVPLLAHSIEIKSPWDKGLRMRVGGAYSAKWVSGDACGCGLFGYYYFQGGHKGGSRWAVDFARRGTWWKGCKNLSGNMTVRNVAFGVVQDAFGGMANGNYNFGAASQTANQVGIRHFDNVSGLTAEKLTAAVATILAPTEAYNAGKSSPFGPDWTPTWDTHLVLRRRRSAWRWLFPRGPPGQRNFPESCDVDDEKRLASGVPPGPGIAQHIELRRLDREWRRSRKTPKTRGNSTPATTRANRHSNA